MSFVVEVVVLEGGPIGRNVGSQENLCVILVVQVVVLSGRGGGPMGRSIGSQESFCVSRVVEVVVLEGVQYVIAQDHGELLRDSCREGGRRRNPLGRDTGVVVVRTFTIHTNTPAHGTTTGES